MLSGKYFPILWAGMLLFFSHPVWSEILILENGINVTSFEKKEGEIKSEKKIMVIQETKIPPVIDGKIEELWGKTTELDKFQFPFVTAYRMASSIMPADPEKYLHQIAPTQKTTARLCYDRKNLYISFKCFEEKMENVRTGHPHLWEDDCVEVFIDPEGFGATYYHFTVNTSGDKFAQIGNWINGEKRFNDWSPEWAASVSKDNSFWIIEMSIPVREISSMPIYSGTKWNINLCREEKPCGENSSWAQMNSGFHEPENFGFLYFDRQPLCWLADINWGEQLWGRNRVILTVNNEGLKEAKLEVKFEIISPKTEAQTLQIKIPPKGKERIQFPYVLEKNGGCSFLLSLIDLNKDKIIGCYPYSFGLPAKKIDFHLNSQEIFLGTKAITGEVKLNFTPATLKDIQLHVVLKKSKQDIDSKTISPLSNSFLLSFGTAVLTRGEYGISFNLVDKQGKVLERTEETRFSIVAGPFD